ncbi:LysR family transcriptional regulator [Caballeronia telluris]|uniref:LysR family transcriptional regulator n=1 Tax=Caballeronia telluris TaxID=326475 RepID=A0A158H0B0_9BURK|nr:LysR family transcriptional regulator [Caballeronia telluris]SAL37742.1 LysR family transcriptional regulator [Caballeronia telluris]
MALDLGNLAAFMAVAQSRGFREAARTSGYSASALSAAVRRLEAQAGVRLFQRTTRSVTLTEAGTQLLERLVPALGEVEAALDVVNGFRESPRGTLRLNVPAVAARLFLSPIVEAFLRAHPDIRLELTVDDTFVDVLAAGCDAGVRYEERLEQDMIAVPIGPRRQRFATAASPAYLAGRARLRHPRDLLGHACIRQRFASGAMPPWEYERKGKTVRVDPSGPLVVTTIAADMAVSAAVAGLGVIFLFEEWLAPAFESGALEPLLEDWWCSFSGPFLYYPSRRYMPAPLRAFVDFLRQFR